MSAPRVTGIGTQLGVQTMVGLSGKYGGTDYCTATGSSINLGNIFTYGIANGSQFIEITPDMSGDGNCQPYMASAVTALMSQSQTKCLY